MKGSVLYYALFVASLVACSNYAIASKSDFSAKYKVYSTATDAAPERPYKNNNENQAYDNFVKYSVMLAEQAAQLTHLAKAEFGHGHINTINLTISAANHYADGNQDDNAIMMYDTALGLLDKNENTDPTDIMNLITEILTRKNLVGYDDRTRLSKDLSTRLIAFFNDESPTIGNAYHSLIYFNTLLESGLSVGNLRGALPLGKRILETSNKILPNTTSDLIRAQYNYARLAEAKRRKSEAKEYYTNIIDVIDAELDYSHPLALASHARLVNIFESSGDSEAATEHCIAIGKMQPWTDDIDATPIYRVNPKYPVDYARRSKEGFVLLQFDITPYGFVENIEVLESEGVGFDRAGINALESWRYAPKFVDGKVTTAKGQKVRLDFYMNPIRDKKMKNS